MKKYIIWGVAAAALVALIIGASFLYNKLSADYGSENLADEQQTEASSKAPDFTMTDRAGNETKLSDHFGKPIVLNLWASWCPPCKAELPDFENSFKSRDDITFIMLNLTDGYSETLETAQSYIDGEGFTFPVYFDTLGEGAVAYGATSIPMTIFINSNGEIVTYATGMLDAATLEKGIDMIAE